MRNGVPPRRRNHPSHPASCEVLESRILLSSADDATGLVVPTYHSSNGHVEATTYDRTTGLDTRFSLSFQRDMDFTKPATFDVYIIDIQLLDHITHALVAHFGDFTASPRPDDYNVALAVTDTSMRLSGTFILPSLGATPLQDPNATIAVDIAWSLQSVDRHTESTSLTLDGDSRQLYGYSQDSGPAAVIASAAWVRPSDAMRQLLKGSTTLFQDTRAIGTLQSSSAYTSDLPPSMNLTPLLKSFTPPERAPASSRISSVSMQYASVPLGPPGSSLSGNITVYAEQEDLRSVVPLVSWIGYSAVIDGNDSFVNGGITTGVTFATDGRNASAKGEGIAGIMSAKPDSPELSLSLNVQWNALPGTLALTFSRTITQTPDRVSISYAQSTQYTATVTGDWSIASPAPHYTLGTQGLLSHEHSITIEYPARAPDPSFQPKTLSPSQWQTAAVEPWRSALQLAHEQDLLSPWPAKRPNHRPAVKITLVRMPAITKHT